MRAEELLTESAWLRRLATRLYGEAGDDLAQETWIAALRRRPETDTRALRPWLVKVLRDAWRMRARGQARRAAREAAFELPDAPTPEQLVERAEAHRLLVDLVLGLDDPYRSTVLLRFHEGLSAAEIARAQGVPAGTVRWRLKVGLDELRARLEPPERRRALALLALPKGALVVKKTSKAVLLVIVIMLLLGAGIVWLRRGPRAPEAEPTTARAPAAAPATPARAATGATAEAARTADGGAAAEAPCGATTAGRIVDAAGNPIAGARVLSKGQVATTGADGRYTACLARARNRLRIEADGYGTMTAFLEAHGRHALDLTMVPEGVVIGRTVDAESGEAAGGVEVTLMPWVSDAFLSPARMAAVSDAGGAFQISGVTPGRYVVAARGPDHLLLGEQQIVVEATQVSGPVVLALARAARVRGRVREDGRPVAGAGVALVLARSGERPRRFAAGAASDAEGRFVIDGVPAGIALAVEASPFEVLSPRALVAGGGEATIEVAALGAIAGRVERNGKPAPGATVHVLAAGAARDGGIGAATSGADGAFLLPGLTAARYRVWADTPDSFTMTQPMVEVSGRERTEGVVLVLDGDAAIAGVVVDTRGAPVEGAEVRVTRTVGDDVGSSVTDLDGRFEILRLIGGSYVTDVRPFREAPQPFPGGFPELEVAGRLDGVRLVVDRREKTITGQVVDAAGEPVADALVRAAPMTGGAAPDFRPWTPWPSARSDGEGAFTLRVQGAGGQALEARLGSDAPTVVSGVAPGAAGVVIKLTSPGALDGELVDLPATMVWARRQGGSTFATTSLRAQVTGGRFHLGGMAPGTYVVSAAAGDGRAAARSVEIRAGQTTQVKLSGGATGRVTGRVVSFTDGTPLPGVRCVAGPVAGDILPGATMWNPPATARSDAAGRFELQPVPEGELVIVCTGDREQLSDGVARVASGGEATVPVVVRKLGPRPGSVGLTLEPFALVPRVVAVDGPAAAAGVRAGELVVAVDGKSVAALAADGVLSLIGDRPSGSKVSVAFSGGTRVLEVQPPF